MFKFFCNFILLIFRLEGILAAIHINYEIDFHSKYFYLQKHVTWSMLIIIQHFNHSSFIYYDSAYL